ncbi:MAG: hypothetical protein CMB73_01850 [Euryarchaeota archaeon]|nr:hypothetical protein [Euryarchaeota archaeon]
MRFNRDKAKTRYGIESLHGAPHKPFLILSILQLIEEDEISSNFIELNSKLEAARGFQVLFCDTHQNCINSPESTN